MTYVMSDIHGCYEQYLQLLDKINFTGQDVLYVLGDVVDYGDKPIEVLRDMSMRDNIIPIVGNHEYFALTVLKELLQEITEKNVGKIAHIAEDVKNWQSFGGSSTLLGFGTLPVEERKIIFEYLLEFSLFEQVTVNGQKYILTHAGLPEGATQNNLHMFDLYDFTIATVDYNKEYFSDVVLVSGHTPTFHRGEAYRGKVFRGNNHLAIDTGGVFGETFACVCLDTGEEFYIPMKGAT